MKWIIPFYLALAVTCLADRADMDRLMGDIQNHHRKLGEVISAKSAAEIQAEAVALREDAKALARKSAGLTETEKKRLDQRVAAIERLTQQTVDYSQQSDYANLQATYQKLQPQIRMVNSIAQAKAVAPKTPARNTQNQLLTDVRNHNRRLSETIAAQNVDETLMESFALREDINALSDTIKTAENRRLETSKNEVVRLTELLEENLADSNFAGAKSTYQQMQNHVSRLIAAAEGRGSVTAAPAPEATQLLADIQNHNRKLRERIAAKDTEQVKQESSALRDDAQALAQASANLDANQQAKLNAAVAGVVDLTQRVERNANRAAFGDVKEHYQKMQTHIARLQTLSPTYREQLNNPIE